MMLFRLFMPFLLVLCTAGGLQAQSFQADTKENRHVVLEVYWDDALEGNIMLNQFELWQFPVPVEMSAAIKELGKDVQSQIGIIQYNPEQNFIKILIDKYIVDGINTVKFNYHTRNESYRERRAPKVGMQISLTDDLENTFNWEMIANERRAIVSKDSLEFRVNPRSKLVTYFIENFKPVTMDDRAVQEEVMSAYRALTIEMNEGNLQALFTPNPINSLPMSLFLQAKDEGGSYRCERGVRRESQVRIVEGVAFVTGSLITCVLDPVKSKQPPPPRVRLEFDYMQFQYNGTEWQLADYQFKE